jgi:hypothetical protein
MHNIAEIKQKRAHRDAPLRNIHPVNVGGTGPMGIMHALI